MLVCFGCRYFLLKSITRKRVVVPHKPPALDSTSVGLKMTARPTRSVEEERLTAPHGDAEIAAARPRTRRQHPRAGDEGHSGVVEAVQGVDLSTDRDFSH